MSAASLRKKSFKWMADLNEIEFFKKWAEELQKHRAYHRAKQAEYRASAPEYNRMLLRRSYKKHAERRREEARQRRACASAESRKRQREWRKQRYHQRIKNDPNYRLRHRMRNRIKEALRKHYGAKAFATMELIGCTVDHLRNHIEALWKDGMSWDNYGFWHGQWHLDHIKPCAAFDLTDPEQQTACFHYTNLQPLWAMDNWRKGAQHA